MSIRSIGANKWIIDYYPAGRKGKRARMRFTGTETEALAFELELRRQNAHAPSVNPKIDDIIPEYLEWLKIHRSPKTYKDVVASLKFILPHFGKYPVSKITPTIVNQYKLIRKGKPRATNKELDYLKGIIAFMVKNNYANPLSFTIEKLPYKRPIPQIPHPSEVFKFLDEIQDPMRRAMVLFMWQTGLRWKEVSRLKWENIDWSNNVVYVIETKGSTPRMCVLPSDIKEILEPQKQTAGWVFVNSKTNKPYTSLKTLFNSASKRAGIKKLRPHLLRHAFATYALSQTGDLRLVQTMLGHKDVNSTQFYAQVTAVRIQEGHQKVLDYIKKQPPK